jgi:hypothetical protein
MKRLPRPAGLLVAAALLSTAPVAAVSALTTAPAAAAVADVTPAQANSANNLSWD